MLKYVQFDALNGCTITKIEGVCKYSEEIVIHTTSGIFKMYHQQSCCESVSVEDFVYSGSDNLEGATVIEAEESSSSYKNIGYYESGTWTFYKLKTTKGELWIRWLGTSNGYYSEDVTVSYFDLEK